MNIVIHPHARERMRERGILEDEVIATVEHGEQFPVKYKRSGFRRNFEYNSEWRGKHYRTKQVEVYASREAATFVVITVMAKYF